MEKIRIVEYQAQYAKSIAEMWNRSADGWMGRSFNSSEAKVLEEEGKGSYLNLYLAVVDDEVLGYARLAMYPEEAGVSYIAMLSVIPEHHGKGIGRMLVQKCVLRAAELGYERIDLFTWAGNTKAVPLYKKCGFFWEKMETQATHLMNFLPGLLNSELLKPWFACFDWYADRKCEVKVEPDGRQENGFDYYDYLWEKNGRQLAISFERCGRGIVSLSTPEYTIKSIIQQAKPVFGDHYKIQYTFENHSSPALEIKLQGQDDGVIKFDSQQSITLQSQAHCEAEYYIEPISREFSEWECSPVVKTLLTLSGKKLELRTGLRVKYPLSINLRMLNSLVFPGRQDAMYVNVQNHYPFACTYRIELPDDDKIHILNPRHELCLQSNERACVQVQFIAQGAAVFNPLIKVTALRDNGKQTDFTVDCYTSIFCHTSRDARNMQEHVLMINGLISAYYSKLTNKNYFSVSSLYGANAYLYPPMIGNPYSEEFETESPDSIELSTPGEMQQLSVTFSSKAHPGVRFALIYRIFASNVAEIAIRVLSLPEGGESKFLRLMTRISGQGLSFEHRGELVTFEPELADAGFGDFQKDDITGNWLFTKDDDACTALIWNAAYPARLGSYCPYWEIDLAELSRSDLPELQFARMYFDVFRNPFQVRNAAQGMRQPVQPIHPLLELVINEGNPIVGERLSVRLRDRMDRGLGGTFQLTGPTGNDLADPIHCVAEDKQRELTWEIATPGEAATLLVKGEMLLAQFQRGQSFFRSGGELTCVLADGIMSVNNGVIRIASPDSPKLPGLISLQYQGQELLDSGYPDYPPKSWLNPYQGGIYACPMQLRASQLIRETHHVEQITLHDQFANIWSGIAIQTEITEYEPLKGLIYRQCYVLHPGVPVLAIAVEIIKNNGWAQYIAFSFTNHLQREKDAADVQYFLRSEEGKQLVFTSGNEQFGINNYYKNVAAHIKGLDAYLQTCHLHRYQHNIFMDKVIAKDSFTSYNDIRIPGRQWLQPQFLLITPEVVPEEYLSQLVNLHFQEK